MSEYTVCMYVNLLLSTTQLKKTMLCNKVKQNSQYYWLNVSSIKNLMYHLLSLFKIDTIFQKLAMWNNCRITEFWIGSDFGDNCWGGGIGMGKTCEPKAFSFQCMTEFTTNKNKKKKKRN